MKITTTAVLVLLSLLLRAQTYERAKFDSILHELATRYKNREDTTKALLYINASIVLVTTPENILIKGDSCMAYAKEGLALSEKLNYKYGEGMSLSQLGEGNYNTYNTSLNYYYKALDAFEQIHDEHNIGRVFNRIGGIFYNIGKYPQAIEYFKKGKNQFEKTHDTSGVAAAHHSLGAVYINLKDFESALEEESLAMKYFERSGNKQKVASILLNIGDCYEGLKEYNKALVKFSQAIRIYNSLPDYTYNYAYNYALILSETGVAYDTIANNKDAVMHPDSLLPKGRNANLAKAVQYYKASYAVYTRWRNFPPIDVLERLSNGLAETGQYKEAYRFFTMAANIKDSMLSNDVQLKIAAQETKRESDLKNKQIEINSIVEQKEAKEQKLYLLGLGLALLLIIAITRNARNQNKKNKELAEEKNKLESANRLISEEKIKLQDANGQIEKAKKNADDLAASLQETIVQKDALSNQLSIAADMKTRFLANISHELRTPVTLLTGMLELMKGKKDFATGDSGEQLNVAFNNSRKLQYMVEEILDLSRLETTQAPMKAEVIELAPVLKRMVYVFETYIQKERLKLNYEEEKVKDIYVQVDEDMLEKVINNLVYNAIKFNEKGGIIKIMTSTTQDNRHFIFAINNTGNPVTEKDLPHIFERFYQGKTNKPRAEGAGIGLSLVKEFVLLMNGTIDVISNETDGTTFTLQLPIVAAPAQAIVHAEESPLPVAAWAHFPEHKTVLIVEDNTEMRSYLRYVLSDNVNLAEAGNGKAALKWLEQHHADLIITDLMMPEMDGEELVNHLKNSDIYRKIPVITLTALADAASRISMLRLGIDDYIVKPFNATELRTRVYNLLNNLEQRKISEALPLQEDDIVMEDKGVDEFKNKIREFVLRNMNKINISVYELAYSMAMSERQLYRLAKRLTGCTPAQLIKEVRLQKAYELLLSGTIHKLDDVSKQVGYEDANYFSRQFTERFGKRPSDFI